MILLREGHVYFYFLADLSAYQLLLKARDKCAGTDGQRVIGSLAALECLSVNEALEIDHGHIAVLNCSVLYGDGSGVCLALLVDLCVYFLIGRCSICLLYLDTLVLTQGNLRLYSYFCCEDEGLALLQLYDIYGRTGYDLKLALVCCLRICLLDQRVCSVIVKYFRSVHLLDHLARNLALTEARNRNLLSILQVSVLERCLYFLCSYLYSQLCHVLL